MKVIAKMGNGSIVYAIPTYYKQTVKVPEGLDDFDIIDMWENDKLETGEVEPFDNFFDNLFSGQIEDIFVLNKEEKK